MHNINTKSKNFDDVHLKRVEYRRLVERPRAKATASDFSRAATKNFVGLFCSHLENQTKKKHCAAPARVHRFHYTWLPNRAGHVENGGNRLCVRLSSSGASYEANVEDDACSSFASCPSTSSCLSTSSRRTDQFHRPHVLAEVLIMLQMLI